MTCLDNLIPNPHRPFNHIIGLRRAAEHGGGKKRHGRPEDAETEIADLTPGDLLTGYRRDDDIPKIVRHKACIDHCFGGVPLRIHQVHGIVVDVGEAIPGLRVPRRSAQGPNFKSTLNQLRALSTHSRTSNRSNPSCWPGEAKLVGAKAKVSVITIPTSTERVFLRMESSPCPQELRSATLLTGSRWSVGMSILCPCRRRRLWTSRGSATCVFFPAEDSRARRTQPKRATTLLIFRTASTKAGIVSPTIADSAGIGGPHRRIFSSYRASLRLLLGQASSIARRRRRDNKPKSAQLDTIG